MGKFFFYFYEKCLVQSSNATKHSFTTGKKHNDNYDYERESSWRVPRIFCYHQIGNSTDSFCPPPKNQSVFCLPFKLTKTQFYKWCMRARVWERKYIVGTPTLFELVIVLDNPLFAFDFYHKISYYDSSVSHYEKKRSRMMNDVKLTNHWRELPTISIRCRFVCW
jgi:hypothetical protein